ncbi:MAG: DNA glycosylase AlkZ-like family protein, partial [Blastocatellia bacterium]
MPTSETLKDLRERAIAASLFRPRTLRQAVDRLGFVQADPIRSPARAQDLILRHRVKDYRVGDIEQQYHRLQLEEDRLHVYGFMPRSTLHLLHPRMEGRLSSTEKRVLDVVATHKRVHPADLEAYFGRKVVRSGWGALSKETTQILQSLHHRGFLRVAGRENGIRVYEPAAQKRDQFAQAHRFHQLVLLIASILGPISDSSLRSTLGYLAYGSPMLKGVR